MMEEAMTDEKNVGGRPRRRIPRTAKRVYMTPRTLQAVKHWQDCRMQDNKELGFSDAVGELVEQASVYGVDVHAAYRIVPISQVFGGLWMRRQYRWIRVDPNNGRRLRCLRCGQNKMVEATRFSGILKALARFVEAHRYCRPREKGAE